MRLSHEGRELIKLQSTRLMEEAFRKNRNELYRLQQLSVRAGGARVALDDLYVEMIAQIVDSKAEAFMAAFRREGLIPTDEEIAEITQDLSEAAHRIWHSNGHQPFPSSQDDFQSILPRARLSMIVAAKEMARDAHEKDIAANATQAAADAEVVRSVGPSYVEPERIQELRQLKSPAFDLTWLVSLCEELNITSSSAANHATAMLVRAIMDHVPPIFGVATFAQVASNYDGAKSFKEAMHSLETAARKIGDAHLHTQIRSREVLPTATQVHFAPQVDFLLAEIVRILK